ncbi:MAG: DUF4175 domain-containing protein [Lewinellaceae bacterium]|nr:DUF4175 domain-containing protein [Saprospiraceae bacterium]MCB9344536.1 DUF4175 domain-containing protein [Lewinellaceae bacterium]
MMQQDNYSHLIEKLDAFIRKFYINQLLRGALYTVGAVLGLFILLNIAEYYLYFGTTTRTVLLWGFLGLSGYALYRWVALPLMHYFHLGKVISHEQAASIIGQHFTNVQDKLLNILQLKQQSSNAIYKELINASINQKSDEIRLVPFQSAIDLGKNRKYLRYALPPIMLFLFLMLGAPYIIREGSMRLWNSGTKYEKPAPFRFVLNTEDLKAVQFSDYDLAVTVDGDALPKDVFISLGNVQYRLNKESNNTFTYKFVNVQKDTEFKLFGGGVESRDYLLNVIRKPNILTFSTKLKFPSYIGRATEELSNVGDLVIPQGTNIGWVFDAQNTDELMLKFGNEAGTDAKRFDDQLFQYNRRALKDEIYKIFLSNEALEGADSVAYTITVIPDLHPQISVEEFKDSSNLRLSFFAGDASDDYGLLNLTFNYQIKKAKGGQMPMQTVKIDKPAGKQAQFDYSWDIRNLDLKPGDEVQYYFEVFDNDAVNGSKSARTGLMSYKLPSLDEMKEQQSANNEQIKQDLEKALKESLKVQEELKKLRDKVLQKKELDWQTRKEMERLLDRQKQLQEQLEQAKLNFDQNKQQQQEFNQQSEQVQEKQEKLEKMMEDTMSEEMQQLIEDIQKLMEEQNKDQALDKMEDMQLKNEEMSKDIERLKELYKQLEVEQMLDEQISNLEELAKDQEDLVQPTEDGEKSTEELAKDQEELNKRMDDLMKNMDELLKKNEELKRPQDIENNKQDMNDAKQDMNDAKQDISNKQNKSAGKKQKSAANKMKNMANKMQQNKQAGEQEQMEEDLKTIRQLLENLVALSFDQEKNMNEVHKTTINTQRYVELTQDQFKIKDDFRLVEDSLQALANRQFEISGVITDKVTDLKFAFDQSLEELEERRTSTANVQQQSAMKGLNDLALLLSEAMQNMQEQMAAGMPGSQSCQKPGNKSGQSSGKGKGKGDGSQSGQGEPKDKMSKGQEDLNKIMKDLKDRLEKQKGESGGGGASPGSSKEFAQLAAKQAAMRKALEKLQKEKMEQGKGDKNLEQAIQGMDQIERDLVNKRLTNEMLKRQQEILTRLLEHEKAEREREQDEKRQAESARQIQPKMPPALEEYLKKRRAEIEQFRTVSPALKPYYKQLVEEYLKGSGK